MAVSGVLCVDKPSGLTSHDVVLSVRRRLGIRRIGHAGTLDPAATGVLVLCVGDSTRLVEYLSADEKAYVGTMLFGVGTDTDDAEGRVTATADATKLTLSEIEPALTAFRGHICQRIPSYSAVHIGGKRAYELARADIRVDLPTRWVDIFEFAVDGLHMMQDDTVALSFYVRCSKGTYIRSLCRDLGEALGVPAHLTSLRRVQSGCIRLDDCVPLDTLLESDNPVDYLRRPVDCLSNMPQVAVTVAVAEALSKGQHVDWPTDGPELAPETVALATCDGNLVAVVEAVFAANPDGFDALQGRTRMRPMKVFWKEVG
ncbi:MAG: tRNA pseudouridine(55) synthase TruB [Alicyclobacillaceae bacterium]|nr:tRNA pseudouridine(55) synthase TruB [Alicyclobacillaceae bacterium]